MTAPSHDNDRFLISLLIGNAALVLALALGSLSPSPDSSRSPGLTPRGETEETPKMMVLNGDSPRSTGGSTFSSPFDGVSPVRVLLERRGAAGAGAANSGWSEPVAKDAGPRFAVLTNQIEREAAERIWSEYAPAIKEAQGEEEGTLTRHEAARLQSLTQERDEALSAALSPASKRLWDLHHSDLSARLRELPGLEWTDETFAAVYAAEEEFERAMTEGSDDPEALLERRQEQMRSVLGDEKLAEYERGFDADYGQISAWAEERTLDASTGKWLHQVARFYEDQRGELLMADGFDDEKEAELERLRREIAEAVDAHLGPRLAAEYFEDMGAFIQ